MQKNIRFLTYYLPGEKVLCAIFLVCFFIVFKQEQLKAQSQNDLLQGFNEKAVLNEFRTREGSELKYPIAYQHFLDFKKQEFLGKKNKGIQKTLTIVQPPPTVASGECGNIDFETGNFTEWIGTTGSNPGCCGTNGLVSNGVNAAVNDISAQHTIVTGAGIDPCGGFPVIPPPMPGQVQGTYACRLGNAAVGAQAEQIEIVFTPSLANNFFTYQYAAVLENAGHDEADQPFFKVEMLDSNDVAIPCTTVKYIAEFGSSADDFLPSPNCNGVSYLPWATVSVDLIGYIGQPITVRFTTADCTAGGHYGYGYLNAECSPITIVQIDSMCAGGSPVSLVAPKEADNTYNWTGPGGPYTGDSISISLPGDYTLTMQSVTGCIKVITYTVVEYSSGLVNVVPNLTICSNATADLEAILGGGASGGAWTGGTGSYSPSNTSLNCTYTPSAAEITAGMATLIFTINDSGGPCPPASDTTVITIIPQVTVTAGVDQTICSGNSASLAATLVGSTSNGIWTGGSGTYAPDNTSLTPVYTPTSTEAMNGSISLVFTFDDTTGFCPVVPDSVTISVNQIPTVNAGSDQVACAGEIFTFAGSIGGAATSAIWSGGSGTFNPNSATLNATYTPTQAEIDADSVLITLTTNDPVGPCSAAIDTIVLKINPLATISAGIDQTICFGNTVLLSGTIGGASTSGIWTGGSGTYTPNSNTPVSLYTPTTAEAASGSILFIFTSDDPVGPCPSVTDSTTVTINQLPTANAGSPQFVCVGESFTLAGSIGGSATSGTWAGGNGIFSPNNTTLNATYTPTQAEYAADSVILTLTTNDPVGPCTLSSSSVEISFYQNPVVNFLADDPNGCPIHCVNFSDATTVGGGATIVSWDWDFGDAGAGSANQNPSNCFSTPGFYDIQLSVESDQGCSSVLTIPQMIEVYNIPVAEFTPTPSSATVINPVVTLENNSSSDVINWDWYFGDGDSLLSGPPSPTHEYSNEISSSYTATLIVENVNGCLDTVARPIYIGPEYTFYIPNAFTPNDDGNNDYFFGSGIGITVYDLWIFDRWGNMVFHGDELNEKWDGKSNGGSDISQIDVFVWKVELIDIFNKKHNFIGTVTLVR